MRCFDRDCVRWFGHYGVHKDGKGMSWLPLDELLHQPVQWQLLPCIRTPWQTFLSMLFLDTL